MSRFYSYLNSAKDILQQYKGDQPFHLFLKPYFSQHKKFGSRDRKQIAQLCYSYFRLGCALRELAIEERLLSGLFMCEQQPNPLLEQLKPEWNERIHFASREKAQLLNFSIDEIFPWRNELSDGVEASGFSASFLVQPDLYLRLRPNYETDVKRKIAAAGLAFKEIHYDSVALPNAARIDDVVEIDKEAVVQDINSQRVGEFIAFAGHHFSKDRKHLSVYDCCAASGGKSILAMDILRNIDLTVSDVRPSILSNLEKRFRRAGITNYHSFIADLSNGDQRFSGKKFDLVICDAPCSGSGTWSRTPEQLNYFRPEKIYEYSKLQKQILQNVAATLSPQGQLLYITCSVFRKENEEVVEFVQHILKLNLEKMELLKGYDQKADTLFAALFSP